MCGIIEDITEKKYLLTSVSIKGKEGIIQATALIDTGSSITLIQNDVIRRANLTRFGNAEIRTQGIDGINNRAPAYMTNIYFNSELWFKNVLVGGANMPPLDGHHYDVLIGMDIISKCNLAVDSTAQKFMLWKP